MFPELFFTHVDRFWGVWSADDPEPSWGNNFPEAIGTWIFAHPAVTGGLSIKPGTTQFKPPVRGPKPVVPPAPVPPAPVPHP